jgi:bla regulator protein BlaR1
MAGALFFLLRWRWNALSLSGLVRRAAVLTDSGWNAQVRALAAQLGIDRHVALLVSDELEVPITTGIMFPKIVLSPDYSEWSAIRRSAILNHELAHIKRLDALTQALGQLATALYWFHPLVWLMVRAMRAERERACDDQVLAAGTPLCAGRNWRQRWPWRDARSWKAGSWQCSIQHYLVARFPGGPCLAWPC